MRILPKITLPSALLIALALCPRPGYSGSASAGSASSAPAAATVPTTAPAAAVSSAGVATPPPAATRAVASQAFSRLYGSLAANTRATTPVLVVPAKEMTAETYDRVVEDLSVMSRIIEKSVHTESEGLYSSLVTTSLYTKGDSYGHTLLLPSDGAGPQILRSSGGRPKAIYVGGYGALFSLRMSFPLVPPPEAPKASKAGEQTDQVWAAAQRELADPESAVRSRRAGPAGQPYKAEAVEDLKNTLTAALKHASNIRDLEPESWLMVLVQGPAAVPEQPQDSSKQALDLTTQTTGGTLLTLRAKKADIDQFAQGRLDETQFRQRVQIVTR